MQYLEKPKVMLKKITTALALSIPCAIVPLSAHAKSNDVIVALSKTDSLGSVLTDSKGKTLYVLLTDSPKADDKKAALAACDKACQDKFVPVEASERPHARNVVQGLLGVTTGASGKSQATFNGWPLYVFADDAKAGDVNGQGFQKVAYVINPVGEVNKSAPQAPKKANAVTKPVDPAVMAAGQEKYAATCAGCHGAAGQGAFGAALAGFDRLANDNAYIKQILVGSGDMPGFAPMLTDADVAAIATFTRNSWGNTFGPIEADQVKALRK